MTLTELWELLPEDHGCSVAVNKHGTWNANIYLPHKVRILGDLVNYIAYVSKTEQTAVAGVKQRAIDLGIIPRHQFEEVETKSGQLMDLIRKLNDKTQSLESRLDSLWNCYVQLQEKYNAEITLQTATKDNLVDRMNSLEQELRSVEYDVSELEKRSQP